MPRSTTSTWRKTPPTAVVRSAVLLPAPSHHPSKRAQTMKTTRETVKMAPATWHRQRAVKMAPKRRNKARQRSIMATTKSSRPTIRRPLRRRLMRFRGPPRPNSSRQPSRRVPRQDRVESKRPGLPGEALAMLPRRPSLKPTHVQVVTQLKAIKLIAVKLNDLGPYCCPSSEIVSTRSS